MVLWYTNLVPKNLNNKFPDIFVATYDPTGGLASGSKILSSSISEFNLSLKPQYFLQIDFNFLFKFLLFS